MEQENMSQIVLKDEKYFNIHRNSLMSLSDAGIEYASKCKFFMLEIPNYITDICDDAFTDCYNLIDIKIPDGVTRIGDYAFASCTGLRKITFPDSLVSIGENAFYECIDLTEITIPKSVAKIGQMAFNGCSKLKNIYCEAKMKLDGWSDDWDNGCNATVIWEYDPNSYADKMIKELFNELDNRKKKERNDEIILYDNETKFGNLIEWLRMGDNVGINPFKRIPDCPGIYKIFITDEDRNKIKFGTAKTVNGKPFCSTFTRKDGRVVKVTVTNAAELQKRFMDLNDNVIYIGKATSLKKRLRQYAQMALGGHSHRGGIDIFAVQDYDVHLHVAWYPLTNEYVTADEWETAEIENFKREHCGQRPLANRAK